jgi:hypothetical protein
MPSTSTTRYEREQAHDELVVFHSPERTLVQTLHVPTFIKSYEEIYPAQSGSHKSEWTSFEHYKVSSGDVQIPGKLDYSLPTVWGAPSYQTTWGQPVHPYAAYSSDWFGEAGQLNFGLTPLYVKRPDGGFVPPPGDLDFLVQRSLDAMLPRIKSDLSLINSVIELKDFYSLPHTIAQIASLPDLYKSLGRLIPPGGLTFSSLRGFTRPLREWFRAGADSYLQAKFNILPLLSDIAALSHAMSRVDRRLNDLITRSGNVRRRHYTSLIAELHPTQDEKTVSFSSTYPGEYEIVSHLTLERYSYPTSTTFHAEIEYNYNYTRYQVEHARILGFLDAIGLNLNPAIIWNAIPWSFVVDWVIGISQWLSQQRIGLMDPKINIRRYLWSVKRARSIISTGRSVRPFYGFGGEPNVTSPTVPLPVVNEVAYRRQLYEPGLSSIRLSGLNPQEFTLGAALVISRRSARHRRNSWGTSFSYSG